MIDNLMTFDSFSYQEFVKPKASLRTLHRRSMTLSSGISLSPPESEEQKADKIEKVDKPEEGVC